VARVYVYVDGFNLYYGSCQGRPGRRWLDLGALSQKLRPADEIVGIRYFSAWVRSQSKAVHQATYVRALRTVPGLHDYMSYFSKETRWMSLVHPTATEDQAEVWKVQEKGSDVNLATSALVSAGYGSGNMLMGGLAVVGPTRMDYPGTMAAVRAVARYVGEIVAGR